MAVQQGVGIFDQHVQRNLDVHGTRTRRLKHRKRPGQHRRQFSRRHQRVGKSRDACDQRTLGRQFMQLAATATQLTARLHAGNHQHRDRVRVGLTHRRGDIGHAGTGDDEADAGLAPGACVTVGHEACTLLVARGDVGNRRTRKPSVELDRVDARNPEDPLHPVAFQ